MGRRSTWSVVSLGQVRMPTRQTLVNRQTATSRFPLQDSNVSSRESKSQGIMTYHRLYNLELVQPDTHGCGRGCGTSRLRQVIT